MPSAAIETAGAIRFFILLKSKPFLIRASSVKSRFGIAPTSATLGSSGNITIFIISTIIMDANDDGINAASFFGYTIIIATTIAPKSTAVQLGENPSLP